MSVQWRRRAQACATADHPDRYRQGAGGATLNGLGKACDASVAQRARRPAPAYRALRRQGVPCPFNQLAKHGLNILAATLQKPTLADARPPTIDPPAAARWARAAPAESPWLHEEVARRMEDRLQWIRLQPQTWVHWDAVRGGLQAHSLLVRRLCRSSSPNG